MDSAGPTIELFQTAAEWCGHGFGTQLLDKAYFREAFANAIQANGRVKFNVGEVRNNEASIWFKNRGFEDWDGMGEEFGKYYYLEDTENY